MKTRRFVDSCPIQVRGGNGGNGSASFRREKYIPMGGPDGGDGGRGGHVILRGDRETDSLIRYHYMPRQFAAHGEHGRRKDQYGRCGADLVLPVPLGTEVWDESGTVRLGDITAHGQELLVAPGGNGGRGNIHFKSSTHQAPTDHTDGEIREPINLRLELKLVADAGLVGFPNAGKSSLISKLSDAHPKIAPYPFTTLNPIMGTLIYEDYTRIRVADIPGLVDGAHAGVGLGHAFLRHIERSGFLIYVIDMAGTDQRLPYEDYRALRKELKLHLAELPARPFLIVANKMDLPEAAENLKIFKRKTRTRPLPVSSLTGAGVEAVKQAIYDQFVSHLPPVA